MNKRLVINEFMDKLNETKKGDYFGNFIKLPTKTINSDLATCVFVFQSKYNTALVKVFVSDVVSVHNITEIQNDFDYIKAITKWINNAIQLMN